MCLCSAVGFYYFHTALFWLTVATSITERQIVIVLHDTMVILLLVYLQTPAQDMQSTDHSLTCR